MRTRPNAITDALPEGIRPRLILVGAEGPEHSFESALQSGDAGAPIAEAAPDDTAWIFYTSGTTGRPKGAMLSHRNLIAMSVNCLADIYRFGPDDRVLHAAPLSHGSGVYLIPALAGGSENIIFDQAQLRAGCGTCATIERERITALAFVAPTMIVRLLDGSADHDTQSLRCIVYGGAPIHVEHLRAAIRRFGPVFVQLYGQGEAPMTISLLPARDHLNPDEEVLRSTGYVRTGVEVRILREDGSNQIAGQPGEIAVRGDVVMTGYWNNPEATAATLTNGWLHTGDIGLFDSGGRLHLLDRRHDTIISGGSNIYPREVEDVLVRHPSVKEAIVFGVPDKEWGESVAAAVVLAEGAPPVTGETLVNYCREHLASFKKPKSIHVLPALPKNAYGKVLRRELRTRFETLPT
jgi:acyl-CoA synthetase (AMP-forming)/AMP-acid ligase II